MVMLMVVMGCLLCLKIGIDIECSFVVIFLFWIVKFCVWIFVSCGLSFLIVWVVFGFVCVWNI